jgi:hypothetical protein
MIKKPQFHVFRYQILPIAREFQTDLFHGAKTLKELLSKKNELFWSALKVVDSRHSDFSNPRVTLEHKILLETKDTKFYKFGVYRHLDRETRDFKHESVDNWPSFMVLIWNHPDKQYIVIEKRYLAFQFTETAIRQMLDPVNTILAQSNLRVHWEPLFEQKIFWDIIRKNKGKIQEIKFELVTPNMANISKTLSGEIKDFAKSTNSANTSVGLVADPASSLSVRESDVAVAGLVDYAAQGGGNISLRLKGIKRTVKTSKTVKTTEIEEAEANDPQTAVTLIKTFLDQ